MKDYKPGHVNNYINHIVSPIRTAGKISVMAAGIALGFASLTTPAYSLDHDRIVLENFRGWHMGPNGFDYHPIIEQGIAIGEHIFLVPHSYYLDNGVDSSGEKYVWYMADFKDGWKVCVTNKELKPIGEDGSVNGIPVRDIAALVEREIAKDGGAEKIVDRFAH